VADSIILRKFGHQIALQEVVAGSCMRFLEASSTSHVVEEACSMLPAHPTFVTLDWEVRGRWLPHRPIAISCCSLPPIDPSVARPCHVAIDPSPSPGVFSEGSMAVGLQVDSLEGVLASHWSDRKNVSGAANQRGCTPRSPPRQNLCAYGLRGGQWTGKVLLFEGLPSCAAEPPQHQFDVLPISVQAVRKRTNKI